MVKVAFITAIMGGYDLECKPFVKQTIDSDFICFTDNPSIPSNGWIIDNTPYHLTYPSPVDKGYYINSIHKLKVITDYAPSSGSPLTSNRHPFNIAKYYKQNWQNIPRLKEYDVVIWMDGTLEIISPNVAEYMIKMCEQYKIVSWMHEFRAGNLAWEVFGSDLGRYHDLKYNGVHQPYQDIYRQYHDYIEQGYDEKFWKTVSRKEGRGCPNNTPSDCSHFGMWITCFVAFNNKSEEVKKFLDLWYLQTLKYTTQDQVGFPKVIQDTKLIPYTLPDDTFLGAFPHKQTSMYIKHKHAPNTGNDL